MRADARGVEIFLKGERIAAHMRGCGERQAHHVVRAHALQPPPLRRLDRSSASGEDARTIGPATAALCQQILEQRPHPEQGFRACLGIVRLVKPFGAARVEAAAERASRSARGPTARSNPSSTTSSIGSRRPARRARTTAPILHPNIRGSRYYH